MLMASSASILGCQVRLQYGFSIVMDEWFEFDVEVPYKSLRTALAEQVVEY